MKWSSLSITGALFFVLFSFQSLEARKTVIITTGDKITEVTELTNDLKNKLNIENNLRDTLVLGYKYSHFGLFWIDLWTWDGQYCLYNPSKDEYYDLDTNELTIILNHKDITVSKPFLYTIPLGLILLSLAAILIIIFILVFSDSQEIDKERLEEMMKDSKYVQAYNQIIATYEKHDLDPDSYDAFELDPKKDFPLVHAELVIAGLDPKEAYDDIDFLNQVYLSELK